MVRVLGCHHFQGQLIGKCEEAVALTLAENVIIVALENKVSIYSALKTNDLQAWFSRRRESESQSQQLGHGEIGKSFSFKIQSNVAQSTKSLGSSIAISPEDADDVVSDELVLFHSFASVDNIKTISYNPRGHYLLTLEKHDIVTTTEAHSVRTYFQWDRKTEGKQMRARIAGLVSPTGGESDDGSLKMIEIPPVPFFATRAVASCCLTGNIACLSSDGRVNIYKFKVKESAGRSKTQYADFDLICTVQLSGANFSPDRISFNLDFISCADVNQVSVFRVVSSEFYQSDSSTRKPGFDLFRRPYDMSPQLSIEVNGCNRRNSLDTVVFDPRSDTAKVYLRTVSKANRKSKQPNLVFSEEFQEDISLNKSSVTFSNPSLEKGFVVEDLLRISATDGVSLAESTGNDFIQVELYPIRILDAVGGVSCIVGTSKEVFIYNLPMKRSLYVSRVSSHPFTSNLISFSFDSLFLHAITESGLETYTVRNICYPLKDAEGFQVYENDCPLQDESPVLVGIRPFVGVRFVAANKSSMCLLSSPNSEDASILSATVSEEAPWTIYFLRLPNIEMLYQDLLKAAQLHQESSPESYFILLCELHLLLRSTINGNPESTDLSMSKYLETCRLIGFEYFRKSTKEPQDDSGSRSDELIDKGVTYLNIAGCDLTYIFSPENSALTKDPALIPGIVRFLQVTLPIASNSDSDSRLSPTLSKLIVEFLANHSSTVLVKLVSEVAWLRECNSGRLIEILTPLAEASNYKSEEALALLLSLVTRYGEDQVGRQSVKELLSKCETEELESTFQLSWLLTKGNKQYSLSDLTICLSLASTSLLVNVLSCALVMGEVSLNDVVVAFAQGVNLNSDVEIQQGLSKALSCVLEMYFIEKLSHGHAEYNNSMQLATSCSPDEIRALHTLVRAYLSNISTVVNTPTNTKTIANEGFNGTIRDTNATAENGGILDIVALAASDSPVEGTPITAGSEVHEKLEQKWQLFGKTASFISLLVVELFVDEKCAPTKPSPFSSVESKENFIKLTSLLGSHLGHVEGVHELVLGSLDQKSSLDTQLHITLQLLCETCDRAIDILMTNFPTFLTLYAKEMFGKSTRCWKILVSKLKEQIKSKHPGVDTFTTIIESVYLHLANVLSPAELEEVLDKGEENAKFYSACRRVELADAFKQKVVKVSKLYLDQTN